MVEERDEGVAKPAWVPKRVAISINSSARHLCFVVVVKGNKFVNMEGLAGSRTYS
jgi:hypothetical protein